MAQAKRLELQKELEDARASSHQALLQAQEQHEQAKRALQVGLTGSSWMRCRFFLVTWVQACWVEFCNNFVAVVGKAEKDTADEEQHNMSSPVPTTLSRGLWQRQRRNWPGSGERWHRGSVCRHSS